MVYWPTYETTSFVFLDVDCANMSVKLQENGSLLSVENITIPSLNTLSLYLETNGHYFEGQVLQLLAKCSGIRELNLSFKSRKHLFKLWVQESCLPGCICHKDPGLWEDEVVKSRDLQKVEIFNFHGTVGEVYLVEQLAVRAPGLQILRINSMVEDDASFDDIEGLCPSGCKFETVYTG